MDTNRRIRVRHVLPVFALAILLTACDSGSAATPSTPGAVSDDAFGAAAASAVEAVLLTESDVPPEYELSAGTESIDDAQPPFALTGACAEFNDQFVGSKNWANSIVEANGHEFGREDPEGFENTLTSNAAVFANVVAARQETDLLVRFVENCSEQFESAFVDHVTSLNSGNDEPSVVNIQMEPLPAAAAGDWSYGVRLRLEILFEDIGAVIIADSVSVRSGRLIGTVQYEYSIEPDPALLDRLVAVVAGRLAAEDASLPD